VTHFVLHRVRRQDRGSYGISSLARGEREVRAEVNVWAWVASLKGPCKRYLCPGRKENKME
jgi:hypothetical protein